MAVATTQQFNRALQGQSLTYTISAQAAAAAQTFDIRCIGMKTVSMFVTYTSNTGSPSSFTFDAKLQTSYDGTTFTDLGSGGISQITSVSTATVTSKTIVADSAFLRLVWTLVFTGGTAPKGNAVITINTTG